MAISTVKATIQMRKGLERDFDADQMSAGEWAVSTDTKYVRMCFAPGIVLRMATYEGFELDMEEIQNILKECQDIQVAVDTMAKLAEKHRNDAEKFSKLSESYAHGKTGVRAGEDKDNSEYYSGLAKDEADRAKDEADRAAAIAGYDIDSELSETSSNPVMNKVITSALDENSKHLQLMPNNWRQGNDPPSSYPLGETIFYSNNPTNKFDRFLYCVVHTINGRTNASNISMVVQYIYPYAYGNNTENSVLVRKSKHTEDSWYDYEELITSAKIDSALSETSLRPVQNKVVKAQFDKTLVKMSKPLGSAGWYRVASISANSMPNSTIFKIGMINKYQNNSPTIVEVSIYCWYSNQFKIVTDSFSGNVIFSKIRAATFNSKTYIEVYYKPEAMNMCYVSYEYLSNLVWDSENLEAAESGETVLYEYLIPNKSDVETVRDNSWSLSGGTPITENSDMNSYLELGNYYADTGIVISSLKNCPTDRAFTMKVFAGAGSVYLCQEIQEYNASHRRFVRNYFGTWTPWYSVVRDHPISFTEAPTRTNLASNDSIATAFGKMAKWYDDFNKELEEIRSILKANSLT